MDGHPSGVPQGPGGQNPAYRPAHRRSARNLDRARLVDVHAAVAQLPAEVLSPAEQSAGFLQPTRLILAQGDEDPVGRGSGDPNGTLLVGGVSAAIAQLAVEVVAPTQEPARGLDTAGVLAP